MSIPGSSESSFNILQRKDFITEVSLASGENIGPNVNSSSDDEEDETRLYQLYQDMYMNISLENWEMFSTNATSFHNQFEIDSFVSGIYSTYPSVWIDIRSEISSDPTPAATSSSLQPG